MILPKFTMEQTNYKRRVKGSTKTNLTKIMAMPYALYSYCLIEEREKGIFAYNTYYVRTLPLCNRT